MSRRKRRSAASNPDAASQPADPCPVPAPHPPRPNKTFLAGAILLETAWLLALVALAAAG